MVFFTDRDLGAEIFPSILRDHGITVERHIDHFEPAAPDKMWLRGVAENGWFALTADKGIMRRISERNAVIRHGVGLFVLVGGDSPAAALARNFVNTFTKIEQFVRENERPFIAKVYRPSPKTLIDAGHAGSVQRKL
ncbi:MAG: hypothetical protein R2832_16560 [Rhodothermales bacterium]